MASQTRRIRRHLQQHVGRVRRDIAKNSANGRWTTAFLDEQRARAAEHGATFQGHEDDPASPAGVAAALEDNFALRQLAEMTRIEAHGGDPTKFARHRDALTRRVHALSRSMRAR